MVTKEQYEEALSLIQLYESQLEKELKLVRDNRPKEKFIFDLELSGKLRNWLINLIREKDSSLYFYDIKVEHLNLLSLTDMVFGSRNIGKKTILEFRDFCIDNRLKIKDDFPRKFIDRLSISKKELEGILF